MIAVIDRIVEEIAVCEELETERIFRVSLKDLPDEAGEGDVIRRTDGKFLIDAALTAEREKKIMELHKRLFNLYSDRG